MRYHSTCTDSLLNVLQDHNNAQFELHLVGFACNCGGQ
jgi:hypothetical protein